MRERSIIIVQKDLLIMFMLNDEVRMFCRVFTLSSFVPFRNAIESEQEQKDMAIRVQPDMKPLCHCPHGYEQRNTFTALRPSILPSSLQLIPLDSECGFYIRIRHMEAMIGRLGPVYRQ